MSWARRFRTREYLRGSLWVREEHRPAIDEELARLDATVARSFADSVDIDRAGTADPQGIGGRSRTVTRGPAR